MIQVATTHSQWEHFTTVMMFYTGIGSALFWSKIGPKKSKVYVLSDLLTAFSLQEGSNLRIVIEFALFVGFGILIGIGVTEPTTVPQALTAGFAWTSMVTKRVE